MRSILIAGEPALWSAGADARSLARENEWKDRVRGALGPLASAPHSILLYFAVRDWKRRGHNFDLDNLVTPVFRAIYGKSNRDQADARAALSSWRAVIGQSPSPFLLLSFLDDAILDLDAPIGAHRLIDQTWTGPLPADSRNGDFGLGGWVQQHVIGHVPSSTDRFAVQLIFGAALRDLTRPEEKPIKPVIDCLYPIFGGGPARGEDWKRVFLQIDRQSDLQGTCHIRCWRLIADPHAAVAIDL